MKIGRTLNITQQENKKNNAILSKVKKQPIGTIADDSQSQYVQQNTFEMIHLFRVQEQTERKKSM